MDGTSLLLDGRTISINLLDLSKDKVTCLVSKDGCGTKVGEFKSKIYFKDS